MELQAFVDSIAFGIQAADATLPIALNKRSGAPYQPGIGPHTESETIGLAISAAGGLVPTHRREVPHPSIRYLVRGPA